MIKSCLCCFNQDLHFSVFERQAKLTERKRDHWVALNSPDLNPLYYPTWGAMLENYHKLQPKTKTTGELKVARLQTIWKELPQEHVNKAVANFTKCRTAYIVVVTSGGHLENLHSVRLQVCIFISSPTCVCIAMHAPRSRALTESPTVQRKLSFFLGRPT